MTPEEFKDQYRLPDDPGFDAMLATVRDEARRAALEEALRKLDTAGLGGGLSSEIIYKLIRPPRTLDDVLADIQPFVGQVSHVGPRSVAWLGRIARTAVEGIRAVQESLKHEQTSADNVVDETIRKILEIK